MTSEVFWPPLRRKALAKGYLMNDQLIHQKIGQLLIDAAPSSAQELIVRAQLFPEGDGGKYEFDYLDSAGETHWFDPDGRAVGDLTDLLVQLRSHFIAQNLTAGAPVWTGCEIHLSIDIMKFGIDFTYEKC